MAARLSIVVPTLNAAVALPATLDAVLGGVATGVVRELVISDGRSTDKTLEIADDAGAVIVAGAAGRGGQLQRGANAATGEWLLFVHADTHLPVEWVGAVVTHMDAKPHEAAVFRLSFRAQGLMAKLTAGWANLRTKVLGLPYGDQGLLISRDLYDEIGGFPDIPLMEDVAMAKALRGRISVLAETVTTDASHYQRDGWLRRGGRNLMTLLRYQFGTDPTKLAKAYHKS